MSKMDALYETVLEKDSEYIELLMNSNFFYFGKLVGGQTSPLSHSGDGSLGLDIIHLYENKDDLVEHGTKAVIDAGLSDETDVIETQGIEMLRVFGKDHCIVVNPHSEFYRDFYPDQIENILSNIEEITE